MMTTARTNAALSASRHPAIRALATAILAVPLAAVIGAGAALCVVLSEPLPVGEKVLWTLFLSGVGLVSFLFGWYLSLLGHAVAELGEGRAEGTRP
jgi:hypothetical protein